MPKDSPEHPYKKYEDTDLWENIKQSIKDQYPHIFYMDVQENLWAYF